MAFVLENVQNICRLCYTKHKTNYGYQCDTCKSVIGNDYCDKYKRIVVIETHPGYDCWKCKTHYDVNKYFCTLNCFEEYMNNNTTFRIIFSLKEQTLKIICSKCGVKRVVIDYVNHHIDWISYYKEHQIMTTLIKSRLTMFPDDISQIISEFAYNYKIDNLFSLYYNYFTT